MRGALEDATLGRAQGLGGRYVMYDAFASGGMATVHFGRMLGAGLSQPVAIKRLHPHVAADAATVSALVNEARMVSCIHHPNVIGVLEVVKQTDCVYIVLEYVDGESLAGILRELQRRGDEFPVPIATGIAVEILRGLHAAHRATGADGAPLRIVHRDVSPQNVLVARDGHVRLIDFGVARAAGLTPTTIDGRVKGKLAYMAPEQLLAGHVDSRTDVYAASIVLWELLCNERFHTPADYGTISARLRHAETPVPPSRVRDGISPELDAVVLRGLAALPRDRYETAAAMADALEAGCPTATAEEIGAWVEAVVGDVIDGRRRRLDELADGSAVADAQPASRPERGAGPELPSWLEVTPERTVSLVAPRPAADLDLPPGPRPAGATTSSSPRPRRRAARVAVFVAAAAAIGAGGSMALARRAPSTAAIDANPVAAPPPVAVAQPARPLEEVTATTAPIAISVDTPAKSLSLDARRAPHRAPAKQRATSATGVASTAAPVETGTLAPPARDDSACTPPYVVDASGVKRYKRECM